MTRKHFTSIAWELRRSHPWERDHDLADDFTAGAERQWEESVRAMARVCAEFNGRFDRERFFMAAGLTRRPDGSMFPMAAPR
jgi:hypothetical protein